jgi:hypothetical protein
MMPNLLSIWDAMIGAYRDSHMPDSWVVRFFAYFVMARVLWGMHLQTLYFGYVIIVICCISFNQLDT